MTKTPIRRGRLERARVRIKQGTNRARFSSITEWDVRLFIDLFVGQLKHRIFLLFYDAVRSKEAMRSEIKRDNIPRTFR